MRLFAITILMFGTVFGKLPELKNYPDPGSLLMASLLQQEIQEDIQLDSTTDIFDDPSARFPGKAMLFSLVVPGAGQLYSGKPMKTLGFLSAEILAFWFWKTKHEQALEQTSNYEDFGDEHWDFNNWVTRATLFGSGFNDINIGTDGSHSLDFYLDMNDDGIPEAFGSSKEDGVQLIQWIAADSSRDHIYAKKNHEFYENIGKYNQFFSGWDDADHQNPDIRETKSGPVIYTENRDNFLSKRGKANDFHSVASYAISAIMFNHVISAVDALFTAADYNRQPKSSKVSGQLMYDPNRTNGVAGVQFTFAW